MITYTHNFFVVEITVSQKTIRANIFLNQNTERTLSPSCTQGSYRLMRNYTDHLVGSARLYQHSPEWEHEPQTQESAHCCPSKGYSDENYWLVFAITALTGKVQKAV